MPLTSMFPSHTMSPSNASARLAKHMRRRLGAGPTGTVIMDA